VVNQHRKYINIDKLNSIIRIITNTKLKFKFEFDNLGPHWRLLLLSSISGPSFYKRLVVGRKKNKGNGLKSEVFKINLQVQ